MRSRRFVALFGGGTADGSGELRGDENEGAEGYGSSDRGSGADVGRRDVGGTARHASARATWRETIRANNRQEALLGGNAERRWYSTLLFAGTTKGGEPRSGHRQCRRRFPATRWRAKSLLAIT